MPKRLIQSLQEAVEYAKGNKTQGYETKIKTSESVEIPTSASSECSEKDINISSK